MSDRIVLLEVKFLDRHKMVAKERKFAKNVFVNLL